MGSKVLKPINSKSFNIKLNFDSFEAFHNAVNKQIMDLQDLASHEIGKKLLLDQLCLLDEKLCNISYWEKPTYSFKITRSQAFTLMILFNGFQSNNTYQDNTIRQVLNPINQILL